MKGHLASRFPSPGGEYSDLKLMQSAAGWYIGTTFTHLSGDYAGLVEPGSRESQYFETKAEAELALESGQWTQRRIEVPGYFDLTPEDGKPVNDPNE